MTKKKTNSAFRAGDLVSVRMPGDILKTLDAGGALDGLPFMPEMLEFCGKRFRVLNRVVQSTVDGAYLGHYTESFVREFRNNDVVTLERVRCSGTEHDECQRGCAIFWKEAWLERVDECDDHSAVQPDHGTAEWDELRSILKTNSESGNYLCQSTEFLKATLPLSNSQRFKKCVSAITAGNISVWGMTKRILTWMWWKCYRKSIGEPTRGTQEKTPTEFLGLLPGEMVEVKSLREIVATLDKDGRNRGLHFSADQRPFCGGRYRVRSRADNFIAEATGEMKHFRNTIILEDVQCDSSCFAFGGCYRSDLLYWREIWVKRVQAQPTTQCECASLVDPDSRVAAASRD
jgi:hypothetical protein